MPIQTSQDIFFREFFKTILITIRPVRAPRKPIMRISPRPITPHIPPATPPTAPAIPKESLKVLGLEKLSEYMQDPSVLSIECPGPKKPLIINRAGRIQPTNLILTKKEIEKIMNEFSEKTRIPLISGVFKAAHQNILITAVISEYLGTRFIIQKIRAALPRSRFTSS